MEAAGGSTEVSVRGQEPPQCGSHGVAQALMTAGGDLPSKRKERGRIQHFRDGVDELLHVREVLCLSIPGLGILPDPPALQEVNCRTAGDVAVVTPCPWENALLLYQM